MVADHRSQVEDLLADYRRGREQLAGVHRALAEIAVSVTSECGLVTATVSAHGSLTDLTIQDAAYQRHDPAELAALVLATTTDASNTAAKSAAAVLAPVLPSGTDPHALLLGTADLTAADLAPVLPVPVEESFEDRTWLESAGEPT